MPLPSYSRAVTPNDDLNSSDEKLQLRKAAAAESRASKIARAHILARDPNYPSDEIIECISRLFARHFQH